jgi:hypothetical protein
VRAHGAVRSRRCYKLPLANNVNVPSTLRKEMSGVCKACFQGDNKAAHARHMQVRAVRTPGLSACVLECCVSGIGHVRQAGRRCRERSALEGSSHCWAASVRIPDSPTARSQHGHETHMQTHMHAAIHRNRA